MDKDFIVLLAARASRMENQDAIDAAIVNMLADPKEVQMHTEKAAYSKFSSFWVKSLLLSSACLCASV